MLSSKITKYLFGSSSIIIIVIIAFVVVLLHIIDMSAGDTWALNIKDRNSFQIILLYSIITIISLIIQAFFFTVSTRIAFRIKKTTSRLSVITKYAYFASHITVLGLIVYLMSEQLLTAMYHVVLIKLIVGLSLITAFLMLISLALTCLKSYSSTRSKIVVVYGIAIITVAIQLLIAFLYIEISLASKPEIIIPDRNPWVSYFYSTIQSKMFLIYQVSKAISFFAVWMASILLTRQYIRRIGKIKYSVIVSIPAIYFLLQYSPLLLEQTGTLSYLLMAKGSFFIYLYNFILNTVNVGSGILFGLSFFILSRSLAYDHLKYYLIICGASIMIIFSSNVSTVLILTPYPAWAIVSLSLILPASFLFVIGLDSATYYIASDTIIRKFLYRHKNEFELFQALGSTKASDMVERKIKKIVHQELDNLEVDTMFKPVYESEDMKSYIEKVITEMKKSNMKSHNSQLNHSEDQPTK